jgi:hypothetical protein
MKTKSKLIKRVARFNEELGVVFGGGVMHCAYAEGEIHLSVSAAFYQNLKQRLPEGFYEFFGFFEEHDGRQRLRMQATQANFKQLYDVLTRVAYHLRKYQGVLAYHAATKAIEKIRQAKGENQPINDGFGECLNLMEEVMVGVDAYQHQEAFTPQGSVRSIRGASLKSHIKNALVNIEAHIHKLPKVKHARNLAVALSVFGAVMILGAGVMMLTGVLAAPGFGLMAAGVGMVASGVTLFQKRARVTPLSSAASDFHSRYRSFCVC